MIFMILPDPDEREIARRAMARATISNCHLVSSIGEAFLIASFEEVPPRLVILAFPARFTDGLEQVSRLRQSLGGPGVPVIALTEVLGEERMALVYRAGADLVATKPVEYEEYIGLLRHLCSTAMTPPSIVPPVWR